MSQSITDRMSHVMQINELMSDSIEISYHFDELSNVIDSAMHGTSLIHIPVPVQYGRTTVPYVQYTCTPVQCTVHVLPVVPYTNKFVLTASPGVRSDTASSGFRRKSPFLSSARSYLLVRLRYVLVLSVTHGNPSLAEKRSIFPSFSTSDGFP